MRYTKATVVAIGAFMLALPLAHLVSAGGAGHEEGDPMMITTPVGYDPEDPEVPYDPISCAVYFADNMVFAPQWRTDGLVRIEMMIIDMTGFGADPTAIEEGTINLTKNEKLDLVNDPQYEEFVLTDPNTGVRYLDQQSFLLNDSDNLTLTSMVSVSYICVTITLVKGEGAYVRTFEAGWLPEADEYSDYEALDRVIFSDLGREVNKHGNLIYGMLWDTAADPDNPEELPGAPAGEYSVDVQLGKVVYDELKGEYVGEPGSWYTVDFAVGHLYVGDGLLLDPVHPFVSLVPDEGEDQTIVIGEDEFGEEIVALLYDDLGVGLGGVSVGKTAWILLGQLMAQGPGGGNGGDGGGDGDNGGNGQGHCGDKAR
jgi:hypothetical protein